ncbi:MAG: hypothetical protein HYV24_12430 [Deltaproteobacteria bacterium]|nr:hypothetical protein [Deltaproteobacteria bacterium]
MDSEAKSALARKLVPGRFYDGFFVSEYGRLEALRAARYNSAFSVVILTLDGGAQLDEGAGLDALRAAAKACVDSIRNCDVAGLTDDGQITVILPETDWFGSLAASRKISRAVSAGLAKGKGRLSLILSNATFPKDGHGYGEVVAAALKRASDRKESVWEKEGFRGRLFWEILGDLTARGQKGTGCATFDAGANQDLNEFFLDQINDFVAKEVLRSPQRRGIAYFAFRNIDPGLPLLKSLNASGALSAKVFLVGEGGARALEIKNATAILLDDPRFKETFFTFYLSEDAGYALVCKENWGETFSCFHTSDEFLVEGLITKFQNEYSLQEQLG